MKKRGQSAIEYLTIVGFAFFVIAVLMIVYFQYNEDSQYRIITSQVSRIAIKLGDTAEETYFLGPPTRTTVKIYLPQRVDAVIIGNREINFRVSTGKGVTDIEQVVSVNVSGNISSTAGIKHVQVIAQQGRVCIVEEGQPECS